MKILISGGTGFVGSRVVESLLTHGHEVFVLTRDAKNGYKKLPLPVHFIQWDTHSTLQDPKLSEIDGIVNLAGENIGEGRWSVNRKQSILDSREITTKKLVEFAKEHKVKFFVSTSATGYYPQSKNNEIYSEDSQPGDDFLSDVCKQWEAPLDELDGRKVILRVGVVLGSDGGLIKKLLPLYRAGLGGVLGSGKQWMSWIHIDDLVHTYICAVEDDKFEGVFNATAPQPVQNKEFNRLFAKYVQRPAFFIVPSIALKAILGEASVLPLGSTRVSTKLTDFKFKTLEDALIDICKFECWLPNKKKKFHYYLRKVQYVEKPIEETFEFFKDAKNLEKITPPFLNFKILSQSTETIQEGTEFWYRIKLHGIPIKWKTIICEWQDQKRFVDYQQTGPYEIWYHRHLFYPMGKGTLMVDEVRYRMPFGYLGDMGSSIKVHSDVQNIFEYRKEVIPGLMKDI